MPSGWPQHAGGGHPSEDIACILAVPAGIAVGTLTRPHSINLVRRASTPCTRHLCWARARAIRAPATKTRCTRPIRARAATACSLAACWSWGWVPAQRNRRLPSWRCCHPGGGDVAQRVPAVLVGAICKAVGGNPRACTKGNLIRHSHGVQESRSKDFSNFLEPKARLTADHYQSWDNLYNARIFYMICIS